MEKKYFLHRFTYCRGMKEDKLKCLWDQSLKEKDTYEFLGESRQKMMNTPILIIRKNHNNGLWFDVMIESEEWNQAKVKEKSDRIISILDNYFENGWVPFINIKNQVYLINEKLEKSEV